MDVGEYSVTGDIQIIYNLLTTKAKAFQLSAGFVLERNCFPLP